MPPTPPPDPRTAHELVRAALTPNADPWRVSWHEGAGAGGVVPVTGWGAVDYPDARTLAHELVPLLARVAPKGTGAGLCGAQWGEGARRTLAELVCWGAVQVDVEAPKGADPSTAPTLAEGWDVLDALGVAAVAHPSPSGAVDGADARRWRAWVRVVPVGRVGRGVDPWARAGARVLRWCLHHLGVGPVDPGPLAPTTPGWVHPKAPLRGPPVVRWREGAAVDLARLGALGVAAGVEPHPAPGRADGAARDGAVLLALATAAGCDPQQRGAVYETRCPREADHSAPGRGGVGLSVVGGWWVCHHSHASTPGRRRGAGAPRTTELVQWALAALDGPTRALHTAALASGSAPARRALARALEASPDDGARVVPRDAVAGVVLDAVADALRADPGAAVLVRATTGAGKSRAVPRLVRRHAPAPAHDTRDAPPGRHPRAVAVVLAPTRAGRDALAGALGADRHELRRRLPVIERGVTEVTRGGKPVCVHHGRALALETAGASVRGTLCADVGANGANACEHHGSCEAESGAVAVDTREPPDPDDTRGRVVLATHARGGVDLATAGVLVVDEACADPYEAHELSPAALALAQRVARWLAPRWHGVAAGVLVRALRADPTTLARHVDPSTRHAWRVGVAEGLARRVDARTASAAECDAVAALRHAWEGAHEGADAPDTLALVRWALDGWVSTTARWVLGAVRPGRARWGRPQWDRWRDGATVPGEDGGGAALAAVRAWCQGAPAAPSIPADDNDDDGHELVPGDVGALPPPPAAWVVAVPKPHVLAVRAHRGPVVGLDATGDAPLWRWVVGDAPRSAPVVRVRVVDGGDVSRVVLAHGRGTVRAMLAPRQRAGLAAPWVRWDAVGAVLAALVPVLAQWREGDAPDAPPPSWALVSRAPVALAVASWVALVRAGVDPSTAGHELVRQHCGAVAKLCNDDDDDTPAVDTAGQLVRAGADARARGALDALARVLGECSPAWWGGVDARGSNALMGARVYVALGDATVPPAVADLRARCTGTDPRTAYEALARESAVQWWGRARTVGRTDRVLLVHAGEHHGWGRADAPRVVGLDGAAVAPDASRPADDDGAPGRIVPVPVPPADGVGLVHALRAAGWTVAAVARAAGVSTRSVAGWVSGDKAPSADALARLRSAPGVADTAAGGALAEVSRRVRAVLAHRRPGDVWGGGKGGARAGLAELLRHAGATVDDGPGALRALAEGRDTDGARALARALVLPCWGARGHEGGRTVLDALESLRPPGAPRVGRGV